MSDVTLDYNYLGENMGLDITAYRNVEAVRPLNKGVDDDGYAEKLARFYNNKDFRGRFDGLEEGMLYRYAEAHGFRAGSYSGYNAWREWLASLVAGYPKSDHERYGVAEKLAAATVWNGASGPFSELINFSDCEGTIGPVVAAKLAKDFAEYDEKAKAASPEGWEYERYQHWRKAMEMAADHGAVDFH